MALINTSVPNLIQGVSQQPDAVRYAGQCDEQVNAISSVVDGLKKRPPMQFVGKLLDDNSAQSDKDKFDKAFIHFIERTSDEKYLVTLREGMLRVFRIDDSTSDGITECNIIVGSYPYANGYVTPSDHYLYSETSDQNIKHLTIGDTTILVNTAKNVDLDGQYLTDQHIEKAVVFVKQADYEKNYRIRYRNPNNSITTLASCKTGTSHVTGDGSSANDTSVGSAATQSGSIINHLISDFNANQSKGAVAIKIDDSHMEISLTAYNAFLDKVSVSDDLFGDGLGLVYKEVNAISDLPTVCVNGLVVKVVGDVELNQDDYYVKFETKDTGAPRGKGAWVETVAPFVEHLINTNTPMTLVNTDENEFTLWPMLLGERKAGDEKSNPNPSFIGSTISNVFLFKSRLGFLSEDAVVMSESGFGDLDESGTIPRQKFNFFRTTVTTLLDSDPIDVRVSNRDVTALRAAQPFQEDLMLFSETAQFKLSGGDLLTPKTVAINQVTNFDYNPSVEPLPLGAHLYFPFDRGAFSGIREYTVNTNTSTFDSEEITQHVPQYVPRGLTSLTGSDAENLIAASSGDIDYTPNETFFPRVLSQGIIQNDTSVVLEVEVDGVEYTIPAGDELTFEKAYVYATVETWYVKVKAGNTLIYNGFIPMYNQGYNKYTFFPHTSHYTNYSYTSEIGYF
jgi:hypothetical protein